MAPPKPALPYPDRTAELLIVTGILLLIALLCYFPRMYMRVYALRYPWWDDWIATLATIFAIIEWALLVEAARNGLARPPSTTDTQEEEHYAARIVFFVFFTWGWTVTFVKISVALMLLRIKTSRVWKIALGILIALQIVIAVVNSFVDTLQCQPYYALYSLGSVKGDCWSLAIRDSMTYLISSLFLASDIICSLLPMWLIYNISRPLFEKIVFVGLMSMGLLASAAGIVRLILIIRISKDPLSVNPVGIFIWSNVEECVGLIASSIPVLKAPLDRLFAHLGIVSSGRPSPGAMRGRYVVGSMSNGHRRSIHRGGFSHSSTRNRPYNGSHEADGSVSLETMIPRHDRSSKDSSYAVQVQGGTQTSSK